MGLSFQTEKLAQLPTVTDLWGYEYDWNDIDKGWYPYRRFHFLEEIERIKTQNRIVKKFTKLGYKVMKIPSCLFETLLNQKNDDSIYVEKCSEGVRQT